MIDSKSGASAPGNPDQDPRTSSWERIRGVGSKPLAVIGAVAVAVTFARPAGEFVGDIGSAVGDLGTKVGDRIGNIWDAATEDIDGTTTTTTTVPEATTTTLGEQTQTTEPTAETTPTTVTDSGGIETIE